MRLTPRPHSFDRREFLGWAGKRTLAVGVAGVALSSLAACADDDESGVGATATTLAAGGDRPRENGEDALVGDVLDYALTSSDWEGAFGFVTFRLHRGRVDGSDVWFVRTDASDRDFAETEQLVWVPRLANLVEADAVGAAYFVTGGADRQAAVLSSEPGRDDYTPAWRVHEVTWRGTPRVLTSRSDVEAAEAAGEVQVLARDVVLNAPVVKWSTGELAADTELKEYLGTGQLVRPPDTSTGQVTFKLHECFPGSRYIVTDTALGPMAEGMAVAHSPRLAAATAARATGRTNVFMNGIEGPGPMGFQPSVFDSRAGEAVWSPYWDHFTYGWKDAATPMVLGTQDEVHARRDAGDLDQFPGTPDTSGETFTVNCPVPVVAPNTFRA